MKRCEVKDAVTMSTRVKDSRGFLVADAIFGRCGLQPYLRGELGLDGDPKALVHLMRTPEEVFSDAAMKSCENAPLTLGHPKGGVDAKSYARLNKGEAFDCERKTGDLFGGKVIAKDEDAVRRIEEKDAALSLGYTFDFDPTPGQYNGQAYDGLQRNIRINHVAIVDVARGGPNCRVLDGETQTTEDKKMKKLVLNGQMFEVEDALFDEVKAMEKKLVESATKTASDGASLATVTAERDALKAKVTELEKRPVVGDSEIERRIEEKNAVITAADGFGIKLDGKGKTPMALRRELLAQLAAKDGAPKTVITAVLGATKVEAADEQTVTTLVTSLAAMPKQTVNAQDATMAALLNPDAQQPAGRTEPVSTGDGLEGLVVVDGPVVVQGKKLVGRDAMIAKQEKLNQHNLGAAAQR